MRGLRSTIALLVVLIGLSRVHLLRHVEGTRQHDRRGQRTGVPEA